MAKRAIWLLGTLTVLLCPARPATGQSLSSSMEAVCVGGTYGCSQVDFFLTLTGLSSTLYIDYLRILLPDDTEWVLDVTQQGLETEHAWGIDYYDPIINGNNDLLGQFDSDLTIVVDATVPTLRVRTAFSPSSVNGYVSTSSLGYQYEVGVAGQVLAGQQDPTVTPEPVSMALLGTGLAGIAAVRRRRGNKQGDTDRPV